MTATPLLGGHRSGGGSGRCVGLVAVGVSTVVARTPRTGRASPPSVQAASAFVFSVRAPRPIPHMSARPIANSGVDKMMDSEQGDPGGTTAITDRSEFDAYRMLLGRVVVRPRPAQPPALQPAVTSTPAQSGAASNLSHVV